MNPHPHIPYPHLNNSTVTGRGWWAEIGKQTGLPQRRGPGGKEIMKDNNNNKEHRL
jgi:hypothetical protein